MIFTILPEISYSFKSTASLCFMSISTITLSFEGFGETENASTTEGVSLGSLIAVINGLPSVMIYLPNNSAIYRRFYSDFTANR